MRRVGLIGCGTIGSALAGALKESFARAARLSAVHDADVDAAAALKRRLHISAPVTSLAGLVRKSDLVLEAASSALVPEIIERCLRANRDLLVMSVGGLLIKDAWRKQIRRSKSRVYVPSGALAGLDGIKAMAIGRLSQATLTTRKPPKSLQSAPYVQQRGFGLDQLTHPLILFEGSPKEAVKHFPQNTNVAAALALASGLSNDQIRVVVMADPTLKHNRHELDVEGDCGRIHCEINSKLSQNPKTSEIAVRSAIATLHRIFDNFQVGT